MGMLTRSIELLLLAKSSANEYSRPATDELDVDGDEQQQQAKSDAFDENENASSISLYVKWIGVFSLCGGTLDDCALTQRVHTRRCRPRKKNDNQRWPNHYWNINRTISSCARVDASYKNQFLYLVLCGVDCLRIPVCCLSHRTACTYALVCCAGSDCKTGVLK